MVAAAVEPYGGRRGRPSSVHPQAGSREQTSICREDAVRPAAMWDIEAAAVAVEDRRVALERPPGSSTWFLLGALSSYFVFVLLLGPRLMANRRPFRLKGTLVVYNLLQVAINVHYITKVWTVLSWDESSCSCLSMMYDRTDVRGLQMFYVVYYFYVLKLMDLMDTVFFVLRKKRTQITFLHLFHHACVVIICWLGVRFYPGGSTVINSSVNAFVHIFMYSYYLLAALHLPGVLVVKPAITILQLVQFVFNMLYLGGATMFCPGLPVLFFSSVVTLNLMLFFLFINFYRKSYQHQGHQGFARKVL